MRGRVVLAPREGHGGDARVVSRAERLRATAVVAFLAAGSIAAIALHSDFWPFSHYPMYSRIATAEYERVVVVGITELGEVDLAEGRYFRPFQPVRIQVAFERIDAWNRALRRREVEEGLELAPPGMERWRLFSATRFLATRYESLRLSGEHDGPPIQGIRLYRRHWRLVSGAANRDTPVRVDMLGEYRFDPEPAS
jgi:hypothetical protein